MKKILIAAYADACSCPRPNRMIHFFKEQYDVSYLGTGCVADKQVSFIPLPSTTDTVLYKIDRIIQLTIRDFEKILLFRNENKIVQILKEQNFDVIVCHDLFLLPLLFKIDNGNRIIFDAREYYPRHFEDRVFWRFFYQDFNEYLCEKYLRLPKFCLTVSEGLATEYLREYDVKMDVMLSLPGEEEHKPSAVNSEAIRIIYHGGVNPSRQIEKMIEVMAYVDKRFSLDLMMVGTHSRYYRKLEKRVRQYSNVSLIPPVPFNEIVNITNHYDIGMFFCLPSTFNLRHTMPNKLFEYIQARLLVAIGPSPDMRDFVETHGVGVVAEKFTPHSMAKALNALSASDIRLFKQRSDGVARKFNASMNKRKILKLVEEII